MSKCEREERGAVMGVILSAKNLQKIYGMGEVKIEAVKDISLEVKAGTTLAVIGHGKHRRGKYSQDEGQKAVCHSA